MFTPLEYGCCGLSEEKAIEVYKKENLEVRLCFNLLLTFLEVLFLSTDFAVAFCFAHYRNGCIVGNHIPVLGKLGIQ